MPQWIKKSNPTRGDVHVNRPLTNISVAYVQEETNFVAAETFQVVPVVKQSDRYFSYDMGDFNRDEMKVRGPSTESAGGGYDLDNTPNYFCNVWAYHKDIDDDIRSNSDDPLDPDTDATEFVTNKALIRRERAFAASYFTAGVWGIDQTGVASGPSTDEFLQWNDAASTPVEDIRAQKTAIAASTGFMPNVLTLDQYTYDALVDHPDIVDRIKYGQTSPGPAVTNKQALAAILDLEAVLVSRAVYNSAEKGATDSQGFILGKGALLTYRPRRPGTMIPAAGYTFSWKGMYGANRIGLRIRQFRIERLKSDRVEIEMAFDQKVVVADLGCFFASAVA
jgi:hypothetical protein